MLKIYERCQEKHIAPDSKGVLQMVQCRQPRGYGYDKKYCSTHAKMHKRAQQNMHSDAATEPQSDDPAQNAAPVLAPGRVTA